MSGDDGVLLQVLVGGLTSGCLYALLLLGVLVVYQVSGTINFAYGQVGMVAALGAWWLYADVGLPVPVAMLVAGFAAAALSAVIEMGAMRKVSPEQPGLDVVVTLGIFLLVTALMQLLVDSDSHGFLALGSGSVTRLASVTVNLNDLIVVLASIAVVVAAWSVRERTTLGLSMRACAADPAIASASGVNVAALRTGTWVVAGLIAAGAAWLVASRLSVDAFYMTPILIKVFVAGMIGGLNRFWAPLAAALGLGVYEGFAVFLFGAQAAVPAVFLLVVVALSAMPKRFLDERMEARA